MAATYQGQQRILNPDSPITVTFPLSWRVQILKSILFHTFKYAALVLLLRCAKAASCLTGETLPAILQQSGTDTANDQWLALDVDSAGSYVFLGGWVDMSQNLFVDHQVTSATRAPVAACFSLANGQYTWLKKFVDTQGYYGEITAVSYASSSTLVLAGVSNDKSKHFIYLVDPLTGSNKQDAFYFESADAMVPLTRNSIVTAVTDRLYWTGAPHRTTGSFGSDQLQFMGVDFSGGVLNTVVHKKYSDPSNTSGQITSAVAVVSTRNSEEIILGGGMSAGGSDSSYVLSLFKFTYADSNIKQITVQYNNGAYYADKNKYQTFAILKKESSTLVGVTWSAESASRGFEAHFCYMPFSTPWDTLDSANAKFLQMVEANDYKKESRILDLFMIDTTNQLAYGVSYDWNQKWLVYFQVNFAAQTMTALRTYQSQQYVTAAVLGSSTVAATDSGINVYRVFLAGYFQGSTKAEIGYNTRNDYQFTSTQVPYLTDNLGSANTCSTESRTSVTYTLSSKSTSWPSGSAFTAFGGLTDQVYSPTAFDYEAKDVKGDKLEQEFCYYRTGNAATFKWQELAAGTFAYTPTLYLDSPVSCTAPAFTSTNTCTGEEAFWLQYIDQTYDIASSDIVGGNIVFNVHSSATPAGIYTLSVYGTLPLGLLSPAYTITLQVMSGAGTSACAGTIVDCTTATDVQIATGTAPLDQTYTVSDPSASININKFTVTSAKCTAADVVYSITFDGAATSTIFTFTDTADPLTLAWVTSTSTDAGTYPIVITGTVTANPTVTATMSFNVVISNPVCSAATDVSIATGAAPVNQAYTIGQPSNSVTKSKFVVTSASCTNADVVYSVTYNGGTTSSIFTFTDAADPMILSWVTSTSSDAGTYAIVITGTVTANPTVTATSSFNVVISNGACSAATDVQIATGLVPAAQTYTVGSATYSININKFTVTSATCTDADVLYSITYNGVAASSIFTFSSIANPLTLSWATSSPADAGTYAVVISGTVTANPTVTATLSFNVIVQDACDLSTTILDASRIVDITYTVGDGQQPYKLDLADSLSATCWQSWTFTMTAALDTGSITLTSTASGTNIVLSFSAYTIQVETSNPVAKTIPLSLKVTKASVPAFLQTIDFNLIIDVGTYNPPLFSAGSTYNATTVNVTGTSGSAVPLGTPYDLDNDQVSCQTSVLPGNAASLFQLDCTNGNLIFVREALLALQAESDTIIKVDITLQDDNSIVQMTSKYILTFLVSQKYTEPEEQTEAAQETVIEGALSEQPLSETFDSVAPVVVQKIEQVFFRRMTVSSTGLATVVFSEPVEPPRNLTFFDETILDIQLRINGGFEEAFYKFTWSVVGFTRTQMEIQLKFDYPLYISAGGKGNLDTLKFSALEAARPLFRAERSTTSLYVQLRLPTEVQQEVPPQLGGSAEDIASLQSASKAAGDSTGAMVAGGLAVNILLASTLSLVWGMINVQQIIIHMSFFACATPQNVLTFYAGILEAINMEMLPLDGVYQTFIPWLYTKEQEDEVTRLLQSDSDDGTDEDDVEDLLQGVAMFVLFGLVGLMMIPCLICLRAFMRCSKIARVVAETIKSLLFWNMTLQLFMESYIEVILSCITSLTIGLMWTTTADKMQSMYVVGSTVIYLTLPAFVSLFLVCSFRKFREKQFRKKYHETIKDLSFRNRWSGLFFALFCYRRLAIVLLIVFFTEYDYFQIMFMPISTLGVIMMLGNIEPFQLPLFRRLEYFNESCILICCYHYFLFTDFVPDPELRYSIGKVLIFFTLGNLLGNISLMVCFMIKKLIYVRKKIQYECRKRRHRFYDRILRTNQNTNQAHYEESEASISVKSSDLEENRDAPKRNRRRRRSKQNDPRLLENLAVSEASSSESSELDLICLTDIENNRAPRHLSRLPSIPEEDELEFEKLQHNIEVQMEDIWAELSRIKAPVRNDANFMPTNELSPAPNPTMDNSWRSLMELERGSSHNSHRIPVPVITELQLDESILSVDWGLSEEAKQMEEPAYLVSSGDFSLPLSPLSSLRAPHQRMVSSVSVLSISSYQQDPPQIGSLASSIVLSDHDTIEPNQ